MQIFLNRNNDCGESISGTNLYQYHYKVKSEIAIGYDALTAVTLPDLSQLDSVDREIQTECN